MLRVFSPFVQNEEVEVEVEVMNVGESIPRVDAFDKATGTTKYTDDLCDSHAMVVKLVHSTIANGLVKSIDISEAQKVEGIVKILILEYAHELTRM